jgi:urease accessory protein
VTAAPPAAFLLLIDGRVPTGSYAHSGGVEAAVADGRVHDVASLERYLTGRLFSTGLVDASFASATVAGRWELLVLLAEAAARCPSPALRSASRAEGRGLLRVAKAMWPGPELTELDALTSRRGPMWSVALGVAARAAGAEAQAVALCAAHLSVSGAGWAAVRLLGLDPYAVASLLARLAPSVEAAAARGHALAASAEAPWALPSVSAPVQEIAAEERVGWEVHLFVS